MIAVLKRNEEGEVTGWIIATSPENAREQLRLVASELAELEVLDNNPGRWDVPGHPELLVLIT